MKGPYDRFTKVIFFIVIVLLMWQVINFELSYDMKTAVAHFLQ